MSERTVHWSRRSRSSIALALVAILSLVLGACSSGTKTPAPAVTAPSAPSPAPASAEPITLGFNREFVSVDTKTFQFDAQLTVLRSVREGLTGLGQDLSVEPRVAEKFESISPTDWKVTLRKGIKYSDGTPVTVADVEAAIKSFKEAPKFSFASQFPEWPQVVKIDDSTFILRTQKPVTNLNRLMTYITIIPAAQNKPADVDTAVGTGPYRIAKFDKGAQTIELEPNPHYYGTPPKTARIKTRFFSEESVRIAALKAGEIHVADSVSPDAAINLASDANISIIRSPGTRLAHLTYNFRKPAGHPIANPKVREALSYAIDGQSIIKNILIDSVSPLKGVVPHTLYGAAAVGEYKYDPAKARAMLKEAGYETNLSITIIWETGEFLRDAQVMEAIASMLKAVGVKVTLKEFASGGDIGKWRSGETGDWDILGNGYGNQTGDAIDVLRGIFGGTRELEAKRQTYHGFVVPEIESKLTAASQETGERRLALMSDAQKLAWNTWPQLWGFTQNNITAVRKTVSGVVPNPTNAYNLAGISTTK